MMSFASKIGSVSGPSRVFVWVHVVDHACVFIFRLLIVGFLVVVILARQYKFSSFSSSVNFIRQDGFEISVSNASAPGLWETILQNEAWFNLQRGSEKPLSWHF